LILEYELSTKVEADGESEEGDTGEDGNFEEAVVSLKLLDRSWILF
jgi:hypothetical protein